MLAPYYVVAFLFASLIASLLTCRKYKTLSEKDLFTNTFHRHWFDVNLVRLMKEAKTSNKPLGLVFIDLDNFKTINDSKGHAYGDIVLLSVVRAIKAVMGKQGKLARYGGDEFCVILPGVGDDFFDVLSQILKSIRNTGLITVSVGGTIFYPAEEINFSRLVNKVDKALYEAKDKGGDCVIICR